VSQTIFEVEARSADFSTNGKTGQARLSVAPRGPVFQKWMHQYLRCATRLERRRWQGGRFGPCGQETSRASGTAGQEDLGQRITLLTGLAAYLVGHVLETRCRSSACIFAPVHHCGMKRSAQMM